MYYNFYNLTTFEVICTSSKRYGRKWAKLWLKDGHAVKYCCTEKPLHETKEINWKPYAKRIRIK